MVFLKEIRSAVHSSKRLYFRRKYPAESLHYRLPNCYLFCSHERFHHCSQPDFGKIWKCTGGSHRYCFKANMFITFLQMGLANGVQPLLGYSYGAGNISRFREVERFTKICCLIAGVAATLLYFVGREPIIRMFISDDEVVYYGVKMLIAYMLSGPVIGMLFVNMNCMQSVNYALPATILSVMRQGVLLIPLLYILQLIAGLEGVIYGQAITDYIAVVLSAVFWRNIRKSCRICQSDPDHSTAEK